MTYHYFWKKFKCCCCCDKTRSISNSDEITPDTNEPPKKNAVVRFFGGFYFQAVTHKIGRWVILACFGALLIGSIVSATQLRINEEQVHTKTQQTISFSFLEIKDEY